MRKHIYSNTPAYCLSFLFQATPRRFATTTHPGSDVSCRWQNSRTFNCQLLLKSLKVLTNIFYLKYDLASRAIQKWYRIQRRIGSKFCDDSRYTLKLKKRDKQRSRRALKLMWRHLWPTLLKHVKQPLKNCQIGSRSASTRSSRSRDALSRTTCSNNLGSRHNPRRRETITFSINSRQQLR